MTHRHIFIALKRAARAGAARGQHSARMANVADRGQARRTIRADDDVWIPAKELADRLGENISEVVRESLIGYVELYDDTTWSDAYKLALSRGEDLWETVVLPALREYIARNA